MTTQERIAKLDAAIDGLYDVLVKLSTQSTYTTSVDGVSVTYRDPNIVRRNINRLNNDRAKLAGRSRVVVGMPPPKTSS